MRILNRVPSRIRFRGTCHYDRSVQQLEYAFFEELSRLKLQPQLCCQSRLRIRPQKGLIGRKTTTTLGIGDLGAAHDTCKLGRARHYSTYRRHSNLGTTGSDSQGASQARTADEAIPFEDVPQRRAGLNAASAMNSRQRVSTITDLERKAFEKLFASIVKKQPGKAADSSNPAHPPSTDNVQTSAANEAYYSDLFATDLDSASRAGFQSLGDQETDQDRAALEKYPQQLRDMAAQTRQQVLQARHKEISERLESEGKLLDPAFAEPRKVFSQIVTALYGCKTDVEIWQTLESEVFTRLSALEKERVQAQELSPDRVKSKRTRSKASKALKSNPDSQSALLPAHYGSLLLLGQRLLARRTPGSRLATALLPHILSHSLSARILGTSTALYNEVMSYQWRMFSDCGNLVSMLREMENSGVSTNHETLSVLEDILDYRWRALRGEYGAAVDTFERTQARKKIGEDILKWANRIREELRQRAIDESRRLQWERALREEEAELENEGFNEAQRAQEGQIA